MNKKFIKSAEALKEINKGNTIYYDTTDGYSTIKKQSKTKYEFMVFNQESDEKDVYYGTIQNVIKTINRGDFSDNLYVKISE